MLSLSANPDLRVPAASDNRLKPPSFLMTMQCRPDHLPCETNMTFRIVRKAKVAPPGSSKG